MEKSASIIDEILKERERQIKDEGYSLENDDNYKQCDLAEAAAAYCISAADDRVSFPRAVYMEIAKEWWPWRSESFKPTTPRRDLVKAAALIVAEIERIDRSAM